MLFVISQVFLTLGDFAEHAVPFAGVSVDFLTLAFPVGSVLTELLWNKVELMVSHLGVEGHGQEVRGSLKFSSIAGAATEALSPDTIMLKLMHQTIPSSVSSPFPLIQHPPRNHGLVGNFHIFLVPFMGSLMLG